MEPDSSVKSFAIFEKLQLHSSFSGASSRYKVITCIRERGKIKREYS
jgi:hypothetical protein